MLRFFSLYLLIGVYQGHSSISNLIAIINPFRSYQQMTLLFFFYALLFLPLRILENRHNIKKIVLNSFLLVAILTLLFSEISEIRSQDLLRTYNLLERQSFIIRSGTEVSFLTESGKKLDNPNFIVTNREGLILHDIVWGYNSENITVWDIVDLSGTPPNRRNYRLNCGFESDIRTEDIIFKAYDFNINPPEISAESIEVKYMGSGRYNASFKRCIPSPTYVLLEFLSKYDNLFIVSFPRAG
jgi:hypothetical protein